METTMGQREGDEGRDDDGAFDFGTVTKDVPALIDELQDTVALLGLRDGEPGDEYLEERLQWLMMGEGGDARVAGLMLAGGVYEDVDVPTIAIPIPPVELDSRMAMLHICTGCINPLNAYLWSWQHVFRRMVLLARKVAEPIGGQVMVVKDFDDGDLADDVVHLCFHDEEEMIEGLSAIEATGLELVTDSGAIAAAVVLDFFDGEQHFLGQWWLVNTAYLSDPVEARDKLEDAARQVAVDMGRAATPVAWRRVIVDDWTESWRLRDERGTQIELRNFTQENGQSHGDDHSHTTMH